MRAGAIVPRQPLVQSTAQVPTGPLELHIYPGADCAGELYDDDGHSMQFAGGMFLRQTVRCVTGANGVQSISFDARQGRFKPWWKAIALVIHGAQTPATIRVNGKTITPTPVGDARTPGFVIPDQSAAVTITATPG